MIPVFYLLWFKI